MTAGVMVAAGVGVVGAGVVARGVFAARSGVLCPVVWRGGAGSGRVALTFDDGPWPGETERVLDILGEAGVKATFFVIGRYAEAHPGLVRRMWEEGHQVGNHTYDHSRVGLFHGTRYWVEQIRRTDGVIGGITGEHVRTFRPPMGYKSPPLGRAASALGHTVVAWSRRGFDGVATTPERIVRAVEGVGAGEIVLLHDGRDPASRREVGATARALPRVIEGIRGR